MITKVLKASDAAIKEAAKLIKNGGLAAFPTDTVYGLGADAKNAAAVQEIYAVKERPYSKAIISLVGESFNVESIAHVSAEARKLMKAFWPGALSIILKAKNSEETIGLRMPADKTALKLLDVFGAPIATTSANISGEKSPISAAETLSQLNGQISLIIDGGTCTTQIESTIVDLSGDSLKILRHGAISEAEILSIMNK